ncbi:hypothetical protein PENTCL1PPCAC_29769, partial [Pristionchus entomophagus]
MFSISVPPSFELAMRRSIFFILLIILYLVFGALALQRLRRPASERLTSIESERIDLKRAELLNVLWAETVARTENDWYRIANQKMNHYEKTLQTSSALSSKETNDGSFGGALKLAFKLITTIGAVEPDELTAGGQLFAMLYSLAGIPLYLLYLTQCNRMLASVITGWRVVVSLFSFVFVGAVIVDIAEKDSDATSFLYNYFSVYLHFSTIGEESSSIGTVLMMVLCMTGLSLSSLTFGYVQQKLEKKLMSSEWNFSKMFGELNKIKEKMELNEDVETTVINNHYPIAEEEEEEEEEEED